MTKLEAEKYRWHDLRKNPDDLPAEDCRVIRANTNIFGSSNWHYDIANFATDLYSIDEYDFYEYKGKSGFYCCDIEWGYYTVSVDAWKYIEPFEEAE